MINDLRGRIPKQEFNVIHAHDVLSMIAVQSMTQKKVLTLHGYFARENIEFAKKEEDREEIFPFLLQFEKEGMKDADHVITVDQRLKEYAMSEFNWPADKITVIHNAVDTNTFKPTTEKQQRELKRSMGFREDHHVVLVPRRLVEKNGVVYAVRALKILERRDVDLVIAGDGPEREKIAAEAGSDARIHFEGPVPHERIAPYYQMADIVLIPSVTSHGIQEATSLAMLEGMACGKIVICSNIGGMKEIIRNMENGILVEEKQPAATAKNTEKTIEDGELRAEIGRNAREYVVRNHSFTAHAARVAQIYREVLGE
jgi:glycosyltransferase involved in cell wall biosynthesis